MLRQHRQWHENRPEPFEQYMQRILNVYRDAFEWPDVSFALPDVLATYANLRPGKTLDPEDEEYSWWDADAQPEDPVLNLSNIRDACIHLRDEHISDELRKCQSKGQSVFCIIGWRHVEILAEMFGKEPIWVFKDPNEAAAEDSTPAANDSQTA